METNFASKAVAGTALGLSIGSGVLALANGGLKNLGIGVAPRNDCPEDHGVSRYEAALQGRISELETEVKLRDANTFTMGEVNKLRDYVERRLDGVEGAINAQAVVNAQVTANISCMQTAIAALQGLTKTVIPIANICPTPAVATTTTTG